MFSPKEIKCKMLLFLGSISDNYFAQIYVIAYW